MSQAVSRARIPALEQLAREASQWTLPTLPPEVERQARLCILDTLGCIIAGTRTEEAALILACELPEGRGLTIPGSAERRPLQAAIHVNGYLGDVLELNDLIGGHASIGNVVAALALAESEGAAMATLVEAVVRGVEVTSRIYSAVYPSLKRFAGMGLVPVGIPSAIGAAAAASHLLGLGVEATGQALAIAGALAGWCPAEVIFGDGGTVKPMLFGAQPGATGVAAALRARAGMTGPARLLESPLGYFATVASEATLPAAGAWFLAEPRRKLHACCGYLHSAIDGAVALRSRLDDVAGAWTVEVHIPGYTVEAVAKARAPLSPNDARFHLQYMLALVLGGVDVILPEHSIRYADHLGRQDVRERMARIRVVTDPALGHYHQCRLVLRDSNATEVARQEVEAPRGSPKRPMADAEVVEKFRRLAEPVLGAGRAARVTKAITQDSLPVSEWIGDLVP